MRYRNQLGSILTGVCCIAGSVTLFGQNTQIKGFIECRSTLEKDRVSFSFGEQDLFISSVLSDRFSFLGETVFKYNPHSHTQFSVSVERAIIKYNINGNHNALIGKQHTPLNYWNETYHHGVLFFPTIDRPLLFSHEIIPFHTTGIGLQGHDLGKLKFGYDLLVGNGLGSPENGEQDNDRRKSVTAAVHIKPADNLRIGASYYNDVIADGANIHDHVIPTRVKQNLYSGFVAYFGKKFEVLAESIFATNNTDSTGVRQSLISYVYGGYRMTEKYTGYFRVDNLHYQQGEVYFDGDNGTSVLLGVRYQANYLTVFKFEFQHQEFDVQGVDNRLTAQVAIGF